MSYHRIPTYTLTPEDQAKLESISYQGLRLDNLTLTIVDVSDIAVAIVIDDNGVKKNKVFRDNKLRQLMEWVNNSFFTQEFP